MIYVASRVRHGAKWRQLRASGVPIISSWIDESEEGQTADFNELWERIFSEINRCHTLIFYAAGLEDFPFKGALVEVGMGIALRKDVFVVLEAITLDGRTMRPVGSWILSKRVHRFSTLLQAIAAA